MTASALSPFAAVSADHPALVLRALAARQAAGERCALVVVAGTEGGAVRADGALMAVPAATPPAGYVSNGCVDADIIAHARAALTRGAPARLRYGKGSPFIDIRLPCGGAIDLGVLPNPDPSVIAAASKALDARREIVLAFDLAAGTVAVGEPGETGASAQSFGDVLIARYRPRLRVRIAGRGPETLALARLCAASGMEAVVQSPDADLLEAVRALGPVETAALRVPSSPPPAADDRWTAFVMMFHDRDWEEGLLRQALAGEAFYIGALGSRRTQAARLDALAAAGVERAALKRIRGPIGLIASQRDAATLAVSALAEIIAVSQGAD